MKIVRVLVVNLGPAALVLAGSIMIMLWVNRRVGEDTAGFVGLVMILWTLLFVTEREKNMTVGSGWRAAVAVGGMFYVFPLGMILLATSGTAHNIYAKPLSGGVFTVHHALQSLHSSPPILCLMAVGYLVVFMPVQLRIDEDRQWRAGSHASEWLAGCAAVLSGVFVLLLRRSGVIPTGRLGPLAIVGFGLGVLLAPFYRLLISEAWKRGVHVVYDPLRWFRSAYLAYQELWGDVDLLDEAPTAPSPGPR